MLPTSPGEAAQLGAPLIVGQDAGSMNHMRRWMRSWPNSKLLVGTTGVSPEVSESLRDDVSTGVREADWVLVGTGHGTLATHAMRVGRHLGRPVLAVVDHWVNYQERFSGLGAEDLPHAVIVTDTHAERLVQDQLRWATPLLWPNELIRELRNRMSRAETREHSRTCVLLLGEPVRRSVTEAFGQPEALLLTGLAAVFAELRLKTDCHVVLRPHPSEAHAKYVPLLEATGMSQEITISLPNERDITQDLAEADIAIGLTTYALYLMWAAGKPAYSLSETIGVPDPFPPGTVSQIRLGL